LPFPDLKKTGIYIVFANSISMPPVDTNYLAVLVGAGINMAVGMFWYSTAGFGKPWMTMMGMTNNDLKSAKKKGMGKIYTAAIMSALIQVWVLSIFIDWAQAATVNEGAATGLLLWLGFVATVSLGTILWENKPVKLYLLNNGYNVVALTVNGALLAIWT